jgi:CubicO group peptidase (beta-lactamase class C family)
VIKFWLKFAKFGVLFLNGGNWQGNHVISRTWVEEPTRPLLPENYADYYPDWFASLPGQAYYNYMWCGTACEEDTHDFSAEGNKGQFIYVSPRKKLVIVRNGTEYGISTEEWLKLFYEFANRY